MVEKIDLGTSPQAKESGGRAEEITIQIEAEMSEIIKIREELVRRKNLEESTPEPEAPKLENPPMVNDTEIPVVKDEPGHVPSNSPETRESQEVLSFDEKYIEDKIREILESKDLIKEIKRLEVTGMEDSFSISATIVAGVGPIKTEVTINGLNIINRVGEKGVRLLEKPHIEATKMEGMVKNKITKVLENIDIESEIKKFIEKETGKKVEGVFIKNGNLEVI